jgi:hypothetical protein
VYVLMCVYDLLSVSEYECALMSVYICCQWIYKLVDECVYYL